MNEYIYVFKTLLHRHTCHTRLTSKLSMSKVCLFSYRC